jgi:hypothetical protein
MNQQTRDMVRNLSKTMNGITIITAAQPSSNRLPNYHVPAFKGPIVLDYLNILSK